MLDHLRIPTEPTFEKVSAKLDGFAPIADQVRCNGSAAAHTSSVPPFATGLSSASEGGLILTEGKAAAAPSAAVQLEQAARAPHFASRAIDFAIAATLCVVLLPVLAFIVIYLVVLERGPVFFAHRRIGRDGQPFACLKFRTMCVDADQRLAHLLATDPEKRHEWNTTQKLLCDPRVTRFGRILRNTSLDELPQLINVLRGEMSIVGPRPIIADELQRYGRYVALYTSVRPGLTGLWQVTRDAQTSYRRRVATDVHYVRNQSLGFDFRILLATIPAVLVGNG